MTATPETDLLDDAKRALRIQQSRGFQTTTEAGCLAALIDIAESLRKHNELFTLANTPARYIINNSHATRVLPSFAKQAEAHLAAGR